MLTITALLLGSAASFHIRNPLHASESDWRGDPCNRATIPWQKDQPDQELDANSRARVQMSAEHTRRLVTRESVVLERGGPDQKIAIKPEVYISDGNLESAINVKTDGNQFNLRIDGSQNTEQWECVRVITHIYLPPHLQELQIQAGRADIKVQDVQSSFDQFDLQTRSGAITFKNSEVNARELRVSSNSGDIRFDQVDGRVDNLQIDTHSGDAQVNESQLNVDRFEAHCNSGNLYISPEFTAKSAQAQTKSGDIKAAMPLRNNIDLRTSSGDIKLNVVQGQDSQDDQGQVAQIDVSSSSGNVNYEMADTNRDVDIHARSNSGTVTIATPPNASAKLVLVAKDGAIKVPEEVQVDHSDRTKRGRVLEGHVGDGPAQLEVKAQTRSGSIKYSLEEQPWMFRQQHAQL